MAAEDNDEDIIRSLLACRFRSRPDQCRAQQDAPRGRANTTRWLYTLTEGVVIETDSMVLQTDAADFDKLTSEITTRGDVHIRMKQAPENSK